MKKFTLFFAMLAIATMASAQIIVHSNGNVGIGTNLSTTDVRLQIETVATYFRTGAKLLSISGGENIGSSSGSLYMWSGSAIGFNKVYGSTYYNHSDERSKEDIIPIEDATSIIKRIKGYSYYFKNAPIETRQREFGVLAQQIEDVLPELVSTIQKEDNLEVKLVNYDGFIPFLIEAIKEQQAEIESLQKKVATLEKCCSKGDKKSIQNFELTDPAAANTEEMKVYQNAPNPFNSTTTIQCYIPQNIQKVQLCVYDMQGVQVKCLTISERGTVEVQIQAGQLTAGIYTYLLIGDGKTSEAKQMILTK